MNFVKKVNIVACQIYLCETSFWLSSDRWIPKASETESAMAIDKIPPVTIVLELETEYNPINIPNVVITPDVKPNPNPFLTSFNNRFSFLGFINTKTI